MPVFDWTQQSKPIVALSPMADMTDSAFCQTVKDVGSPIMFREMVSAEAVVRGNDKTLGMTAFSDVERPIIQQIFGSDPATMADAARRIVDEHHPEGIDINMGCPVYKLTCNFNGAALMKEPERARQIVERIRSVVDVPVSVKIRTGWQDPTECQTFCKVLEDAGAALLTVHGRTKQQAYSGYADWSMIRSVQERVNIPVLANGDIFSATDAERALHISRASGVLVARGALGNPWIFPQIQEQLTSGNVTTVPTIGQHFALILSHARRHIDQYGARGMVTFRKHLSWYTKGLPQAKHLRGAFVRVNTLQDLEALVAPFLASTDLLHTARLASPQPNQYPLYERTQA